MVSSYVGENATFEKQYLGGDLELELTPQVPTNFFVWLSPSFQLIPNNREPWLNVLGLEGRASLLFIPQLAWAPFWR